MHRVRADVPTLSSFFAIYTDGSALNESFRSPVDSDVFLGEMGALQLPGSNDELFGPYAAAFSRAKFKRGFLLGFKRELKGRSEQFFEEVRAAVLAATAGVEGFAFDVLRLWPFPLAQADEALPEHVLGHIGYSILPAFAGHGYASAALAAMLGVAREAGLPEISITCDETNHASRRIIEKNGGRLIETFVMPLYGPEPHLRFILSTAP